MKRLNPLIWLVFYPLVSLVISYNAIQEIDITNSRALVYILSALAVILPIVVLAVGIKKIFKLKRAKGIVIASFISSLFWVVLAIIANRYFQSGEVNLNIGQSLISVISFTLISCLLILAIEYVKMRLAKTSNKKAV